MRGLHGFDLKLIQKLLLLFLKMAFVGIRKCWQTF